MTAVIQQAHRTPSSKPRQCEQRRRLFYLRGVSYTSARAEKSSEMLSRNIRFKCCRKMLHLITASPNRVRSTSHLLDNTLHTWSPVFTMVCTIGSWWFLKRNITQLPDFDRYVCASRMATGLGLYPLHTLSVYVNVFSWVCF